MADLVRFPVRAHDSSCASKTLPYVDNRNQVGVNYISQIFLMTSN